MRRIPGPVTTATEIYDACIAEMTDESLKKRFIKNRKYFIDQDDFYKQHGLSCTLYTIPATKHKRKEDPIITADITKSEATTLYSHYMLRTNMGRKIYDHILISTKEDCPFCGGIGRAKTIDHYLPKSKFPQLSILPLNLIPACRDCNTGKLTALAKSAGEQALHPFIDDDCFFNEQWISASINKDKPVGVEFHASPPQNWHKTKKERVINHFKNFEIAQIYNRPASQEISTLIYLRGKNMSNLDKQNFSDHLHCVSETIAYVNDWKKIMYKTLAADDWFCSQDFT